MAKKSGSKGRGWHGAKEEHRQVGRLGGEARKDQIESDPSMSYQKLGEKGGQAAQRSGKAHRLTDEERARGGRNSRRGRARSNL